MTEVANDQTPTEAQAPTEVQTPTNVQRPEKVDCAYVINRGKEDQRKCPTGTRRAHGYCKAHERYATMPVQKKKQRRPRKTRKKCAFTECVSAPFDHRGYCEEHVKLINRMTKPSSRDPNCRRCTFLISRGKKNERRCTRLAPPGWGYCMTHGGKETFAEAECLLPSQFGNCVRIKGAGLLLVDGKWVSEILADQSIEVSAKLVGNTYVGLDGSDKAFLEGRGSIVSEKAPAGIVLGSL